MRFSEEAIKKLKECKTEESAKEILFNFLEQLGFANVVKEYKKINKRENKGKEEEG